MKKLILLVAVMLFSFNVSAQVGFGVKAGVNFASVSGDDTDDLDSRTGFHFGVVAGIPVSDGFSVQPELIYSQQGAEYTESEGYDGKFKLDYLNIPVLAQFKVSDGFSIEAGPQFGFLMSANDEYDDGAGDSGEDDVKDFFKNSDFSAAVGLNYQLPSGLNFGARYNIGLGNISEFDGVDVKNNVFQISIGWIFGNGGGE